MLDLWSLFSSLITAAVLVKMITWTVESIAVSIKVNPDWIPEANTLNLAIIKLKGFSPGTDMAFMGTG